jgi:hypothetical protein
MGNIKFSSAEIDKFIEYFGKKPEDLTVEEFETRLKELRIKYHPDKFEKYADDTIKELTEEKFKEIEHLSGKMKIFLSQSDKKNKVEVDEFDVDSKYAYNDLKIEIMSDDKDFKYILFGTHYRWLERGDRYPIRGTNAYLIMDDNHHGNSIGFMESIKIYLTFLDTDPLEDIVLWLYLRMKDRAKYVIIGNKKINIDYYELLLAIKRKTLLKLGD